MSLKKSKILDETGDETTNRVDLRIPFEVYGNLLQTASELDFGHAGKVAVLPLVEAVSQIEPEVLYEVLRSEGLLPRKSKPAFRN